MKKILILFLILIFHLLTVAQENLPTDYLSKEFHKARREAFRNLMPENSVAVIFSYPERNFSADVDYVFHQNPNFYYLTGYNEPTAVLLIFKENQQIMDSVYKEIIFVRDRDKNEETWTGRRLGTEGAKNMLGFDFAFSTKKFKDFPLDFKQFK
jgi:Xaa-Pro aminopeptidase